MIPRAQEQSLPVGGRRARQHLPEVVQAAGGAGIVPARDVQDRPVHLLVTRDRELLPVRIHRRMVESRLPMRIGLAQLAVELAQVAGPVDGTPVGDRGELEGSSRHAVEPLHVVLGPEGAVPVGPVAAPTPRTPRRDHGDEVWRAARGRRPLHPRHVGAPQHPDTTIAPGLARDPFHRVVAVLEVVDPRREDAVGVTAPPHVLDGHGVAVRWEVAAPGDEIVPCVGIGRPDQNRGRGGVCRPADTGRWTAESRPASRSQRRWQSARRGAGSHPDRARSGAPPGSTGHPSNRSDRAHPDHPEPFEARHPRSGFQLW